MVNRKWSVRYGIADRVREFAEKYSLEHERIGPAGNSEAYEIVWFNEQEENEYLDVMMTKYGRGWS